MEITSLRCEVGTDINIRACESKNIKALWRFKLIKHILQWRRKVSPNDTMDFMKRSWWKTYRLAKWQRNFLSDKWHIRPLLTCNVKWQGTNLAVRKRSSIVRLSVPRTGFHVGFVVDKVDTGTFFFFVNLGFPLSLSFLKTRAKVRSLRSSPKQMSFRKSEWIKSKNTFIGKIFNYIFPNTVPLGYLVGRVARWRAGLARQHD